MIVDYPYAVRGTEYPDYIDGPGDFQQDVGIQARFFTNSTDAGLEAGAIVSLIFTIDRPAKAVWSYFKDFNLWQNATQHYYSGVVGDLEGKTFALGLDKNDLGPQRYNVIRVVPEHFIVIHQPIPADGSTGGVSPGFHVFTLNEHGGKTVITGYMQHSTRTRGKSVEEALAYWRGADMAPEWVRKWRDEFIPALKQLVYGAS